MSFNDNSSGAPESKKIKSNEAHGEWYVHPPNMDNYYLVWEEILMCWHIK